MTRTIDKIKDIHSRLVYVNAQLKNVAIMYANDPFDIRRRLKMIETDLANIAASEDPKPEPVESNFITITVNGEARLWLKKNQLTYSEILVMAGVPGSFKGCKTTVTFYNRSPGVGVSPLLEGQAFYPKDGCAVMVTASWPK